MNDAPSLSLGTLNTLCFADVEPAEPAERAAAATLSSVSMLLAQSLGIVVSTLLLAGAKAASGHAQLGAGEFRIAFFAVCAIGLASVALYAGLPEHVGAEVSGRASPS